MSVLVEQAKRWNAAARNLAGNELAVGRLRRWSSAIGGYIVIALVYIPIVWLAVMSVSAEPLTGQPGPFTADWYLRLFSDLRWSAPLQLSIGLAAAVGIACALVATLVGRALLRARWRGGLLIAALLPLFVPGVVMGTALFLYFRSFLGFKLGLWSLFIGHFSWALALFSPRNTGGFGAFRRSPDRSRSGAGCDAVATVLGCRVSCLASGYHHSRSIRFSLVLQRTSAQHFSAWPRNHPADFHVGAGIFSHVERAVDLRAELLGFGSKFSPYF